MANNVQNVFAAMPRVSGALLRAPLGTALPTTAKVAPPVAFIDQGFIGEEGFTQSESRSTDKKKAFGGTVVKILQTDYSVTIQFAFLESINAEVLKSIYGEDNVEVRPDGEIVVRKNKTQSPHAAWIVDVIDGNALNRTCIGDGQITTVDDIVKVHSDTIMYTVTMECFEDENGDNLVEYFASSSDEVVLTIVTGMLNPGQEGVPYGPVQLVSYGGEGDVTWALNAGDTLPAGLTLSAAGVIEGTPTEAGTYGFVVTATDSTAGTPQTSERGLTIVIAE